MWIDFKLCSYFWFDNQVVRPQRKKPVVNWFQIMFLFLVRQLDWIVFCIVLSCELISNYVLIFGSTTQRHRNCIRVSVVNWFQIMFLFLVRQLLWYGNKRYNSCELISNYVLIFGSTTKTLGITVKTELWIDFKLCSYFWFDNAFIYSCKVCCVVNWFQIMFLFLVRQPNNL